MSESVARRATVMVVEDFKDSREVLAAGLRLAGYEVTEAGSGGEALERAGRERPDLVLMDLTLPGLDGLSAVYRLRELDSMSDVPIVACTAHSPDLHMRAARAVGCDDYVTKPVDIARLVETVGRLLESGRPGGAARPPRPMEADELLAYIDGLLGGGPVH